MQARARSPLAQAGTHPCAGAVDEPRGGGKSLAHKHLAARAKQQWIAAYCHFLWLGGLLRCAQRCAGRRRHSVPPRPQEDAAVQRQEIGRRKSEHGTSRTQASGAPCPPRPPALLPGAQHRVQPPGHGRLDKRRVPPAHQDQHIPHPGTCRRAKRGGIGLALGAARAAQACSWRTARAPPPAQPTAHLGGVPVQNWEVQIVPCGQLRTVAHPPGAGKRSPAQASRALITCSSWRQKASELAGKQKAAAITASRAPQGSWGARGSSGEYAKSGAGVARGIA